MPTLGLVGLGAQSRGINGEKRPAADGPDTVVEAYCLLVPCPVASELVEPVPVAVAEVPVGAGLGVAAAALPDVAIVPESVVPVALEPELLPLAVALVEELPLASALAVELVPVELHAASDRAARLAIRRAWNFFIVHSCCKSVAIMAAHMPVRNRMSSYRRVGLGGRSVGFVAMRLLER
jgi:hypothetical protein